MYLNAIVFLNPGKILSTCTHRYAMTATMAIIAIFRSHAYNVGNSTMP